MHRRIRAHIGGWWKAHRGGIAASVVATLIAVVILAAFDVIPRPFGGSDQTSRTSTDVYASVITTPLPPGVWRDPPGHKLRTFGPNSSAEFFGGRLVVSIGRLILEDLRKSGPGVLASKDIASLCPISASTKARVFKNAPAFRTLSATHDASTSGAWQRGPRALCMRRLDRPIRHARARRAPIRGDRLSPRCTACRP
jgi:hypothetical protein